MRAALCGYEVLEGKPSLEGMPATFAGKEEGQGAQTLVIFLKDDVLNLKSSCVTACSKILTPSSEASWRERRGEEALSGKDFKRLPGYGQPELRYDQPSRLLGPGTHIQAQKVGQGKHAVGSTRGESTITSIRSWR